MHNGNPNVTRPGSAVSYALVGRQRAGAPQARWTQVDSCKQIVGNFQCIEICRRTLAHEEAETCDTRKSLTLTASSIEAVLAGNGIHSNVVA